MARLLPILKTYLVFQVCSIYGVVLDADPSCFTYTAVCLGVMMILAPAEYSL